MATLIYLGKTKESGDSNCPSLHYHPERGTFIVQGWKVTDPKILADLDIPDNETVAEVPADVLELALQLDRDAAAAATV